MANLQTEIRKLRPAELYSLAKMLSPDFWKILMGNIKKPGSQDVPMFTSEHIIMIETAAMKQRKSASEVFLDEWATMGRERPTIKTTIDLLVEAELFRAADFLAVDVLKGVAPNRPSKGPAAVIEIPDDILEEYNQQSNPLNNNLHSHCCSTATIDKQNEDIGYPLNDARITASNQLDKNIGMIEVQFSEKSMKNDGTDAANDVAMNHKVDENKEYNENGFYAPYNNGYFVEQSASFLPNLSVLRLDSNKIPVVQETLYPCNMTNFPRELESSELPLCINNRDIISPYHESFDRNQCSTPYSSLSDSQSHTTDDSENLPKIYESNGQKNERRLNDHLLNNIVDYNELPLTVVEFCKN